MPNYVDMETAISKLDAEDREDMMFYLNVPDLYPARSIKDFFKTVGLEVRTMDIHAWRKARGIKKATC